MGWVLCDGLCWLMATLVCASESRPDGMDSDLPRLGWAAGWEEGRAERSGFWGGCSGLVWAGVLVCQVMRTVNCRMVVGWRGVQQQGDVQLDPHGFAGWSAGGWSVRYFMWQAPRIICTL